MLRDDTRIEKLITEATELADDECYDESILLYDEALKISKGDVKIMVDKAITLVSAEREKEALLLYESALESDPKNPDILVNEIMRFGIFSLPIDSCPWNKDHQDSYQLYRLGMF